MAAVPQVHGLASVYVNVGEGSGLALMGYTENGVFITEEPFFQNVPGDENGGDDGPPIDKVYMGEVHRVRLELSKWDATVCGAVEVRCKGGTLGTPTAAGTLMFAGAKDYRLLINCTTDPRNYLRAVPESAIELNKGTKYARFVVEFTCYKNASGVLYNAVTT